MDKQRQGGEEGQWEDPTIKTKGRNGGKAPTAPHPSVHHVTPKCNGLAAPTARSSLRSCIVHRPEPSKRGRFSSLPFLHPCHSLGFNVTPHPHGGGNGGNLVHVSWGWRGPPAPTNAGEKGNLACVTEKYHVSVINERRRSAPRTALCKKSITGAGVP